MASISRSTAATSRRAAGRDYTTSGINRPPPPPVRQAADLTILRQRLALQPQLIEQWIERRPKIVDPTEVSPLVVLWIGFRQLRRAWLPSCNLEPVTRSSA